MKQGDIVLVPFPFSDLTSVKTRPALVISNQQLKGDDLLLCGISSVAGRLNEIGIENIDLQVGKLPVKSYVKLSKVVSLDKAIIRKKVASLKASKNKDIVSGVWKLIKADK